MTGSNLKDEGKFRQRVDNHYKMMAAARSRLGTAGRLQLAAALGVGSVAGVGAVASGALRRAFEAKEKKSSKD